jgi:hypothetical protein
MEFFRNLTVEGLFLEDSNCDMIYDGLGRRFRESVSPCLGVFMPACYQTCQDADEEGISGGFLPFLLSHCIR